MSSPQAKIQEGGGGGPSFDNQGHEGSHKILLAQASSIGSSNVGNCVAGLPI